MPADRGRIKQNLRAAQRGQPRRFRIPLVPANADADLPVRGRPGLKPEIARREVKLLVIRGIVRDVHLAILAQVLPVRVDDGRGVVINAGGALLEKRGDDHDAGFPRDFLQLSRRRPGNLLGQREVGVVFRLAKILRAKQFRQANDLRACLRRLANARDRLRHVCSRVGPALHLHQGDLGLLGRCHWSHGTHETYATDSLDATGLLLHRIGRDDLDALDVHRAWSACSYRRSRSGHSCVADFVQHVVAFDQFAEGGVLAIEKARRSRGR